MNSQEYVALRNAATRRAHLLRQEALHAFWAALVRRLALLAHRGA